MGTIEQRMQIAFRCYDVDNDEEIDIEEMRLMLVNIPFKSYYDPCRNSIQEPAFQNIKTSVLVELKNLDTDEINHLVECIYDNLNGEESIFFEEFMQISKEVTSELYVAIYDTLFSCIPLIKNFNILRCNYH